MGATGRGQRAPGDGLDGVKTARAEDKTGQRGQRTSPLLEALQDINLAAQSLPGDKTPATLHVSWAQFDSLARGQVAAWPD